MVKLFVEGLRNNQRLVADQLTRTFGMTEQTAAGEANGAASGRGVEYTTPIGGGATARNLTAVLVLRDTEVGRVIVPIIDAEVQRRGVRLAQR